MLISQKPLFNCPFVFFSCRSQVTVLFLFPFVLCVSVCGFCRCALYSRMLFSLLISLHWFLGLAAQFFCAALLSLPTLLGFLPGISHFLGLRALRFALFRLRPWPCALQLFPRSCSSALNICVCLLPLISFAHLIWTQLFLFVKFHWSLEKKKCRW